MEPFYKKHKCWFWLIVIVIFIIIVVLIKFIPELYINYYSLPYDKLDAIRDVRLLVVQIIGGILVIIGIWLTWKRTKATEELTRATENQVKEFARKTDSDQNAEFEKRMLEQYAEGVKLLIHAEPYSRLAGIYALEIIMNTSPRFHNKIIELFCTKVNEYRKISFPIYLSTKCEIEILKKQNKIADTRKPMEKLVSEYDKPMETELQAILTALGKRKSRDVEKEEKIQVDIRDATLYNINLSDLDFNNSVFIRVLLSGEEAKFVRTVFIDSDLRNSIFEQADLRGAKFDGAYILQTNFDGANLEEASFIGSTFKDDYGNMNIEKVVEQFSKVKTLYKAEFDQEIKMAINDKYPELFEKPVRN